MTKMRIMMEFEEDENGNLYVDFYLNEDMSDEELLEYLRASIQSILTQKSEPVRRFRLIKGGKS